MVINSEGRISIMSQSDEFMKTLYVSEIYQILVNSISGNHQLTFTFKDENNNFDIFFEDNYDCEKFLKIASDKAKNDNEKRRELFIVK